MRHRSYELWYALAAIILITILYLLATGYLQVASAASGLFGHSLGILGFLLMLMTETLYSLRKRSHRARWGRMANWLQFHIVTGVVGPYMVLLHTLWKFNGLAGVVTLLMVIVVSSGFVGRYIYTAVPRTADGIEVESNELERQIAAAEAELQRHLAAFPSASRTMTHHHAALPEVPQSALLLVLGRTFLDWGYRWQWWREKRQLDAPARAQAKKIERLLNRRRLLRRQVTSLALTRRMLSTWRTIHIPIGVTLFTVAFIHIGAAIYYATLLK
jgi:hypothetical protein